MVNISTIARSLRRLVFRLGLRLLLLVLRFILRPSLWLGLGLILRFVLGLVLWFRLRLFLVRRFFGRFVRGFTLMTGPSGCSSAFSGMRRCRRACSRPRRTDGSPWAFRRSGARLTRGSASKFSARVHRQQHRAAARRRTAKCAEVPGRIRAPGRSSSARRSASGSTAASARRWPSVRRRRGTLRCRAVRDGVRFSASSAAVWKPGRMTTSGPPQGSTSQSPSVAPPCRGRSAPRPNRTDPAPRARGRPTRSAVGRACRRSTRAPAAAAESPRRRARRAASCSKAAWATASSSRG